MRSEGLQLLGNKIQQDMDSLQMSWQGNTIL